MLENMCIGRRFGMCCGLLRVRAVTLGSALTSAKSHTLELGRSEGGVHGEGAAGECAPLKRGRCLRSSQPLTY